MLCRSLQGEPYAAVFHRRIKMSSGGHRLKIEQKFQLLAPGVMPVKFHSIWHRSVYALVHYLEGPVCSSRHTGCLHEGFAVTAHNVQAGPSSTAH